jgi:hypothetical protein
MNYKKHKKVTVSLGGILLACLLLNLSQILVRTPRSFTDMFRYTREFGMPWIPYISLAIIFLSAVGAAGLIKYRRWGFYGIYLSYVAGASVVWFPFSPLFIFQFASGIYVGILELVLISAILGILIYLHLSGKKHGYFGQSAAS